MNAMLALARGGIEDLFKIQENALKAQG
jgi:hypothetical protein